MKTIGIVSEINNETTQFAMEELKKYLCLMGQNPKSFVVGEAGQQCKTKLTLGFSETRDEEADAVEVNVDGLNGEIRGSNCRSILYGVYQYLEHIEIRWVRHGKDGEYIPQNHDVEQDHVHFSKKAKNQYRGICIEGSESIENMLDNIDWAAKMGFNIYFIQFIVPYEFFKRWYQHDYNPLLEERKISVENVLQYKDRMIKEIKKRGIVYHAVGHGWTCEPLGVPGLGWDATKKIQLKDEVKNALALVNGKRDIWQGIPLNTNLCYSNPAVRKKMVDFCVKHIEENKDIDVIHFWLADGFNNHCECVHCQKSIPSDFYIKLLNELDAALIQKNLATKIVFLVYRDLLWPPVVEKLKNKNRFILMFAPITRDYKESYEVLSNKDHQSLPQYKRNQLVMPKTLEQNVAFLKEWQSIFHIHGFAFEYYFYVKQYLDYGGMNLASVIYKDIRFLPKLKLSGIVSCQTQRAFMPTGVGMWVMAKALWDDTVDFDDLVKDYFSSAFGEYAIIVQPFLIKLSEYCKNKTVEMFEQINQTAQTFLETLKTIQIDLLAPCHKASIHYLKFYCNLIQHLTIMEKNIAEENLVDAKKAWKETVQFIQKHECSVQSVFDVWCFTAHILSYYKNFNLQDQS